jgi:cytochrome P450
MSSNDSTELPRPSEWDPGEFDPIPSRMAQQKEMRERCPVAYTGRGGGYWTLLRHADIVAATMNTQTFSNGGKPRHGLALPPLETDPPLHREYRFLLNPFFMPRRIQALEPRVRAIADELLEPLLTRQNVDLAREYSYPLPVLGLCAVLDLPSHIWPDVKRLSEESLGPESADPEVRQRSKAAHEQLMGYARNLVADRRVAPRDSATDIVSAILAAQVAGQPISEETAAGMVRLLISAGHNSTTSALGNALLYLTEHAEIQQQLRAEPGRLPIAIEELLRYETPVQAMPRYLREDTVVGERALHAGERVDMVYGSANRDEQAFEQADECLLERSPNRHLAFGHGIHTCLGANLARMEIRVALEQLLKRTRQFTMDGEATRPEYHRIGVNSLPVRFEL